MGHNERVMKNIRIFSLLLSGLVLGFFIVVQFTTPKAILLNSSIDEINAKELLLSEFISEQSYLLNRTKDLREKIEEKQIEIAEQTEDYNLNFLEDLKKVSGLKSINGQGIEITFSDSSGAKRSDDFSDANGLVLASDLRDIVNALLSGQADAVSINNQRIVSGSVISSVGNTILINNIHSSSPFLIKAVGDPQAMLSSLQNKYLLSDLFVRIENQGLKFIVQINDEVYIAPYNGDLKVNHINLVE